MSAGGAAVPKESTGPCRQQGKINQYLKGGLCDVECLSLYYVIVYYSSLDLFLLFVTT